MSTTNNIALTAPINSPGVSPVLTLQQIWTGLQQKIRSAETFVSGAIQSTAVISESVDPSTGNPVTVREVVFRKDQRQVREVVTSFEFSKVVFTQPDGSVVNNIVSEGADGALYLTYTFEWRHPGASKAELADFLVKEKAMSKLALEETIRVLRELARDGKL